MPWAPNAVTKPAAYSGATCPATVSSGRLVVMSLRWRRRRAAAQQVARDQRDDDHPEADEQVQREALDDVVDRGDVGAGQVAQRHPQSDPQCRAQRIEREKTAPRHAGDTGDDAIRLTQPLDEPGDGDDFAAVPGEEPLGGVQPSRGEEHVPTQPQRQPPATEMADGETDVVPDDSREKADHGDQNDVQLPGTG